MVRVLKSIVVDHGFETRSSQIKDYKIGICCFYVKHTSFKEKKQTLVGSESG
jgi:hypothetical protein